MTVRATYATTVGQECLREQPQISRTNGSRSPEQLPTATAPLPIWLQTPVQANRHKTTEMLCWIYSGESLECHMQESGPAE